MAHGLAPASVRQLRKTAEGKELDMEVSLGSCSLVKAHIFIKFCKVRLIIVIALQDWFVY